MAEAPVLSGAHLSKDRRYRYCLWRFWQGDLPYLNIVGLNPSIADASKDDPTLVRCMSIAANFGFGGVLMTNLFALRSTDPRKMLRAEKPVGRSNRRWLEAVAGRAGLVVAAWGNMGSHNSQAEKVLPLLGDCFCLGRTGKGAPRHPLYLSGNYSLSPYTQSQ